MNHFAATVGDRLELWIPTAVILLLWAFMQYHDKLPSVESIGKMVAIINSRGGNIAVLAGGSIYFFKYSMYLFFMLLGMVKDKTITQDNAFALMAIQFITTSAFGGAMGALLKTMTGESSSQRASDSNGSGKISGQVTNTLTFSGASPTGNVTERGLTL